MVTLDEGGRATPWTRLFTAPAALGDVVEHAWTQRVPTTAGRGWRIVADASPHLLVLGLRSGNVRVRVVGARTHWVDAPMVDRAWTAGVRLRPGTLHTIAGVCAAELTDRGEDIAAVFGASGRTLLGRVHDASSPDAVVDVLFAFVGEQHARVAADARVARLASMLTRRGGGVRDLAAYAGMAERTLRQLCADAVGLSPVRVGHIARLHRALELRYHHPFLDWSRIAIRAGYADQPHMIRHFNTFLGESPVRFVARGQAR